MAQHDFSIDWSTTIPTLIGSISSLLGAGFILLCYCILPQKRHFRHALIINLAVADFINALNNSSSGLWLVIQQQKLQDGPGCVSNGFIGQLSVQATDCSILMIAIVTLLHLRQVLTAQDASMLAKVLLCGSAWVLPVITSFTALGLGLYHPVQGNWCWIQARPTYLRYVLTHMWRFVIIVASTGIYVYIYIHLKRHFKHMKVMGNLSYGDASHGSGNHDRLMDQGGSGNHSVLDSALQKGAGLRKGSHGFRKLSGRCPVTRTRDVLQMSFAKADVSAPESSIEWDPRPALKKSLSIKHKQPEIVFEVAEPDPELGHGTNVNKDLPPIPLSEQRIRPLSTVELNQQATEARIKKAFLLNAYPIMYIILWIPGIMNRIAEASGHPNHVLAILQSTTQFVGLANAITYGLNEKIWPKLKERFHR